jgi:hypothetical protein
MHIRPKLIPIAVIGSLAALTLGACGGGSRNTNSAASGSTPQTAASAPSGFGGGQRPAASGLIATVDATTMQVQSQQAGQVAVTWSDSTKFSHTVTVTASSINAGQCVTAIAPSGTTQTATAFTATTVMVSDATNGDCGRGFGAPGGGNGGAPAGRPSGIPNAGPSGVPSGGPGGAGGFGGIASGKVVSVSGSSVVVAAQSFGPNGGSTASTTTNKTITIGSDTKVSTQASTTSKSVVVGKCATVQGTADSSGAVAATSVSVTDADNGQCTGGFGGFNGNR